MVDKTTLLIADADKPLSFLELDDLALAQFARGHLIQIERAVHRHAGNESLPLDLAMSMHGAIALYRLVAEAGAEGLTLHHEGVEWSGEQHGDWTITITRSAPAPETEHGK